MKQRVLMVERTNQSEYSTAFRELFRAIFVIRIAKSRSYFHNSANVVFDVRSLAFSKTALLKILR